VREVLEAVERITSQKLNIAEASRREGDAVMLISDAEKIKKILDWVPRFDDLTFIVKSAIEWEKKIPHQQGEVS